MYTKVQARRAASQVLRRKYNRHQVCTNALQSVRDDAKLSPSAFRQLVSYMVGDTLYWD